MEVNELFEISEKYSENASDGKAIDVINNLFEQEGRLLIVGNAGVGKTVLLLKLANDLFNQADISKEESFPVIFNLASWSEDYKDFKDWLIAMLNTGEGLSKDFAEKLLDDEKIIFFLDGLDELARNEEKAVAEEIQAKCLDSLNKYLDYGKKVVICSRTDEFLQMQTDTGQQAPVHKIIRVKDLSEKQIRDALANAEKDDKCRTAARNLTKILDNDTNNLFLNVLQIPFYFTTALEVFDRHITNFNTFPENEDILKDWLIYRLIERKLEKNKGKYNPQKTLKWLKWVAQLMKKKDLVVFELADLQPSDLGWSWIFKILNSLLIYLGLSIIFGVIILAIFHTTKPLELYSELNKLSNFYSSTILGILHILFIVCFFTLFLMAFFVLPFSLLFSFRISEIPTEDINKFSLSPLLMLDTWKQIIFSTILYSSLAGLIFAMLFTELNAFLLGAEFIGQFVFLERVISSCRITSKFSALSGSYQRLLSGFSYLALKWCLIFLIVVLWNNFWTLLKDGETIVLTAPLVYPIAVLTIALFIAFLNASLAKHFVLRFCLFILNVIPVKYATFLNYSAKTGLLQKDGGFWRFRHQELQDYFARLP